VSTRDDEHLENLSEAVVQLTRRQRELEERVRTLESPDVASPAPLPVFEPPIPAQLPSRDSDGAVPVAPPPSEPDHLACTRRWTASCERTHPHQLQPRKL